MSSDSFESCLNKQLEKIEQEEEKCEGGGKSAEKVQSGDGSDTQESGIVVVVAVATTHLSSFTSKSTDILFLF